MSSRAASAPWLFSLGIGSTLLVIGGEGAESAAEDLARRMGLAWARALAASQDPSRAFAVRGLPARPDVVVCLELPTGGLSSALAICRDRGTVVIACRVSEPLDIAFYSDAHRRGLCLRFVPPLPTGEVGSAALLGLLRVSEVAKQA